MFAKLTALVGGGYSFPYNVEEAYNTCWGGWTHHKGTNKEDSAQVSIFKFQANDPSDPRLAAARNGVKRLKMLRHPNVLAYKDSAEVQERGTTIVYLVTEAAKPLINVLDELNLPSSHKNEYLAMGMLHVATAVSFLNNDCKMIHGNVCMSAVVVTESLDWKLSGFDLLSEHSLPSDFSLSNCSWMVGNQYKPAELAKCEWQTIQQSPPWAVDAWGLGCLMQEVFSGEPMAQVEQLRRTDVIPPALLQDYQRLLGSAPTRRLNPSKVAESKFLNNTLVGLVAFMENIAVKDSIEKDSFFKKLPATLPALPAPVLVRKILPLLSSALEFGGAPASAVSSLLLIGKSMDSDEFQRRVVPCISKLFASSDRSLRRNLLEAIDQYGPHLTTSVVEEQIFPHLQAGFGDGNAYIRELTLKSILTLAPKLSSKTLTQSVLKHLSKLQIDEEASIRANTTVLLGNISQYLGEATCKRVLLNAFTRALKDNFPPARIAGLRAMVATSSYYSPEEAATRIIPCVAPLAMDGVGEVRSASLQCLDCFVKVLAQHDRKAAADQAAAAQAAGTAVDAGMGAAAPSINANSMLSWAYSSLVSGMGAKAAGGGPPPPAPAAAAAAAASPTGPAAAAVRPPPAAPASTSSKGGWESGDGDGWDMDEVEVDAEEVAARSRLAGRSSSRPAAAAAAAPSRPTIRSNSSNSSTPAARVSSNSGSAAAAAAGGDGWGGGDDDEAWEDMDRPAAPSRKAVSPPAAAAAAAAAGVPRTSSSGSMGSAAAGAAALGSRTVSARARPAGAAGAAAGARKPGAMKLGAQKLGAQKLSLD